MYVCARLCMCVSWGEVSAVNIGWYRTIEVEGVKVNFQLDTGVKCNIISHNVFKTKVASVTSVCGRAWRGAIFIYLFKCGGKPSADVY